MPVNKFKFFPLEVVFLAPFATHAHFLGWGRSAQTALWRIRAVKRSSEQVPIPNRAYA